jgi:hypothetical protein
VAKYVFSTLREHEELQGAVLEMLVAHRGLVQNAGMRQFFQSTPGVMLHPLEIDAR